MKQMRYLLVISIVCMMVAPVNADSLWSGVTAASSSYFVDEPVAPRAVNDIVFILINESTMANSAAEQELDSETKVGGDIKSWFHVDGWRDLLDILTGKSVDLKGTQTKSTANLPEWEVEIKNEYEGSGETSRNDSVKTKVAATVIEVKPNGTLLLEAKRAIRVNNEKGQIFLTGVARPDDIGEDNQIDSSKIAELRLSIVGKGGINDAQKPGIFTKLLGYLR